MAALVDRHIDGSHSAKSRTVGCTRGGGSHAATKTKQATQRRSEVIRVLTAKFDWAERVQSKTELLLGEEAPRNPVAIEARWSETNVHLKQDGLASRERTHYTARMTYRLVLSLVWVGLMCALAGCPTQEFCVEMAARCGGNDAAGWTRWCRSECVPAYARAVPCDANASCGLCDAPSADGSMSIFALPTELEYMWTLTDEPDDSQFPSTELAPTGTAFNDGPETWEGNSRGEWLPYEPFPALHPLSRAGFCEPGPNRFTSDNVVATDGALVLRADRMIEAPEAPYCPGGRCQSGPYSECGEPARGCQYGEAPEESGLGSGSQATRGANASHLRLRQLPRCAQARRRRHQPSARLCLRFLHPRQHTLRRRPARP